MIQLLQQVQSICKTWWLTLLWLFTPVPKLFTPKKKAANEKNVEAERKEPSAPKIIKSLASLPSSSPIKPVKTAVAAMIADESEAPNYYDHIFVMEQLHKFVEDPFDGKVYDLPIPKDVIGSASKIINDFKDVCANLNANIAERKEVDEKMKGHLQISYQRTRGILSGP